MATLQSAPEISVVMPAYNAAHLLPRSLPAVLRAAGRDRTLVVDPGSTDGTRQVAESLGARVLSLPHRAGPAEARNAGVEQIDSEIVLFVDADCVLHPDVIERVRAALSESCTVSVMGSYDDTPPEENFFSLYMNLRHHYTHQRGNRTQASFWAGCGAVRRGAFLEVGGFDAERFPRPMIEDIELGLRLRQRGATHLDPDMQATHLKRWTLQSVIDADIRNRAIPWTELILETGEIPDDLNLRWSQRLKAVLAPFVLGFGAAAPMLAFAGVPMLAVAALLPAAASIAMHADLIRYLRRRRGARFALAFWLFHQVHLSYSAGVFGVLSVLHRLRRWNGGGGVS